MQCSELTHSLTVDSLAVDPFLDREFVRVLRMAYERSSDDFSRRSVMCKRKVHKLSGILEYGFKSV